MVDAARARSAEVADRVQFAVADAASLPYDGDAFDLVTQLNMPVYPSEIARVLQPGGHVVVASSLGPATPYYTPHPLLRRRFARLGLETRMAQVAEPGDYLIACRPS